jgi:uncharacterized membrane protein
MSISVTCYTSKNSPSDAGLVEEYRKVVDGLGALFVEIPIDSDSDLLALYGGKTPVIKSGPYTLSAPFTAADLEVMVRSAMQRASSMADLSGTKYDARVLHSQMLTHGDRFGIWFTRNYVRVIILLLAIFVGLPFAAPILEESGHPNLARVIYTVYRPFCHQLSFRSYFLYGEQTIYPRQLAGINGVQTYEQVTGSNAIDINQARNFVGNKLLGFKVGLCERDVAIYLSVILFAILFDLTGRKMKQLPWYWWVILAIVPIGLDGFSQLPSLMVNPAAWMPIRESTPLLRTVTGFLFGFFSAWFVFPLMEESVATTRVALQRKVAIIQGFNRRNQEDKPS